MNDENIKDITNAAYRKTISIIESLKEIYPSSVHLILIAIDSMLRLDKDITKRALSLTYFEINNDVNNINEQITSWKFKFAIIEVITGFENKLNDVYLHINFIERPLFKESVNLSMNVCDIVNKEYVNKYKEYNCDGYILFYSFVIILQELDWNVVSYQQGPRNKLINNADQEQEIVRIVFEKGLTKNRELSQIEVIFDFNVFAIADAIVKMNNFK